jgi:hypothetical protein
VPPDVGEEELQAVARARRDVGLVDDGLGLRLLVLLLDDGLADLEPDALELAGQLLDVGVGQVVLDGERLELGRLDPPALLARVEKGAGPFGLKQFGQLVLRQVLLPHPFLNPLPRSNLLTVRHMSCAFQAEHPAVGRVPSPTTPLRALFRFSPARPAACAGACVGEAPS